MVDGGRPGDRQNICRHADWAGISGFDVRGRGANVSNFIFLKKARRLRFSKRNRIDALVLEQRPDAGTRTVVAGGLTAFQINGRWA